MARRLMGRTGFFVAAGLGVFIVIAASFAGGATYGIFTDDNPEGAETITIVHKSETNVEYKDCGFIKVRPEDSRFTLEITIEGGETRTYDETDFDPDGFNYMAKHHFDGKPDIDYVILNGTKYTNPLDC